LNQSSLFGAQSHRTELKNKESYDSVQEPGKRPLTQPYQGYGYNEIVKNCNEINAKHKITFKLKNKFLSLDLPGKIKSF
jgi:hypothetical protein